MLWALLLTLHFSSHEFEPDTLAGPCVRLSRWSIPETRLRGAVVRGWPIDGRDVLELGEFPVRAQGGAAESVFVDWDGRPWTYCVSLIDNAGNEGCPSCISVGPWSVGVPPASRAPALELEVLGAPGSREREFRITLPAPGRARLWVADVAGREFAILLDRSVETGRTTIGLGLGPAWPSGIYLAVLDAGGRRRVARFVVIR